MGKKNRQFRRKHLTIPLIGGWALTLSPLLILLVHSCQTVNPTPPVPPGPEPIQTVNVYLEGEHKDDVEIDKTTAVIGEDLVLNLKLKEGIRNNHFIKSVSVRSGDRVIECVYNNSTNALLIYGTHLFEDVYISIELELMQKIPVNLTDQNLTYLIIDNNNVLQGIHIGTDVDTYNTIEVPSDVVKIADNAFANTKMQGHDYLSPETTPTITRLRFLPKPETTLKENKMVIGANAFGFKTDTSSITGIDTRECINLSCLYNSFDETAFEGLKTGGYVLYNSSANSTDKNLTANFLNKAGLDDSWVRDVLTPIKTDPAWLNLDSTGTICYGFKDDVTKEQLNTCNTLLIPDGVIHIQEEAFKGVFVQEDTPNAATDHVTCSTIHTISLPYTINQNSTDYMGIGEKAFFGCNSITTLDASAFTLDEIYNFTEGMQTDCFNFEGNDEGEIYAEMDGGWILYNTEFEGTPEGEWIEQYATAFVQTKAGLGEDAGDWFNDNNDPGREGKDFFYRDIKNNPVAYTERQPIAAKSMTQMEATEEYLAMVKTPVTDPTDLNANDQRWFALDLFDTFSIATKLQDVLEYFWLPKFFTRWEIYLSNISAYMPMEVTDTDVPRITFTMVNNVTVAKNYDLEQPEYETHTLSLTYENFPVYTKHGDVHEHFREDIDIPASLIEDDGDMFQIKFKADLDVDKKAHHEITEDEIWLTNDTTWRVEGYDVCNNGVTYEGWINHSNFADVAHTYMKNWALFFKCILIKSCRFENITITDTLPLNKKI